MRRGEGPPQTVSEPSRNFPRCDLCGEAPCLRGGGGAGAASASVSTMLSALAASGLSRSHVERRELERAYDRLRGSCGGAECLAALREACTRKPRCRRDTAEIQPRLQPRLGRRGSPSRSTEPPPSARRARAGCRAATGAAESRAQSWRPPPRAAQSRVCVCPLGAPLGESGCLGCVVPGCGGGADADCVICQEPLQRSPAVHPRTPRDHPRSSEITQRSP